MIAPSPQSTSTAPAAEFTQPRPASQRVAWFLNHCTLREFEVPFLQSLGYEIYTAKQLPFGPASMSASVDYSDDRVSTLPKSVLEALNAHNFYEDQMTPEIKYLLNTYFDTVFCAAYAKLIDSVAHHFSGRILLRAFGREHPNNYTEYLAYDGGQRLTSRLHAIQDRLWLAACYRSIPPFEGDLLKKRSVVLPLGLPESIFKHRGQNTGTDPRILFVCPRIEVNPEYYGKIYADFKKNFGDFDHIIAGSQARPMPFDSHVAGFVDDATYQKWFREMRVMYYHSREPRHIHYHPLEAVVFGMPLVFMRGGLLEELSGGNQPGACSTIGEARRKIKALLQGDQKLAADIRQAQPAILHEFSKEYNRGEWERLFTGQVMKSPLPAPADGSRRDRGRPRKMAVMLPHIYRGGTLRAAKDLAVMLHTAAKNRGDPLKIVFSCVANHYDMEEDFKELFALGISVRETQWSTISRDDLKRSGDIDPHRLKASLEHDMYVLPLDGSTQFSDCDFWLVISDRLLWPLAPICSYAMLTFDYIQRYMPDIFGDASWQQQQRGYIPSVRAADFAMCTTPGTGSDLNSYAGVPRSRIVQLPMFFECMKEKPGPRLWKENYLIWITNPTPHKNHDRALRALARYYEEFGGALKTVIVGPSTEYFRTRREPPPNVHPYIGKIRNQINENTYLRSNLIIAGELSNIQYLSALKYARFMLHATLIDNGTFTVIDAAHVGTPSLSARYPAMEFMNDNFKLNLTFFDPHSVNAMASALYDMEQRCASVSLPGPAFLETFDWQHQADVVYDRIVSHMPV